VSRPHATSLTAGLEVVNGFNNNNITNSKYDTYACIDWICSIKYNDLE